MRCFAACRLAPAEPAGAIDNEVITVLLNLADGERLCTTHLKRSCYMTIHVMYVPSIYNQVCRPAGQCLGRRLRLLAAHVGPQQAPQHLRAYLYIAFLSVNNLTRPLV